VAYTLAISGSIDVSPTTGNPSGVPTISTPLSESIVAKVEQVSEVNLLADAVAVLPFGGVTNAHFILLRGTGGKFKARLTSADGATQIVPVDQLFVLFCESVPVTAIDIQRVTGIPVVVSYHLAEKNT
jgi:hypothetical protein